MNFRRRSPRSVREWRCTVVLANHARNAAQRIEYAQNETNYCPRCQTGGKVLADRQLSRLLKGDWPGTVEELEDRVGFAVRKSPKKK